VECEVSEKKDISLAAVHPEIAREWMVDKNSGYTPDTFTPDSNFNAWWECSENPTHQYLMKIKVRVGLQAVTISDGRKPIACPVCFDGLSFLWDKN
jgi:hypothetical protein